jgi:PKD repeat protein
MRRIATFCWLLLVVALLPALVQAHEPPRPSAQVDMLPGALRIVRAERGTQLLRIPAPARLGRIGEQSATFNVTYNGCSTEAKQAFQRAVDIWSGLITSPVPIKVVANWTPLEDGILGSAGPKTFYRDFPNTPQAGTFYPVALANKLAGQDLNDATEEIVANFNSSYASWYLGVDGNTPSNDYDLVTVVLHELGHGLGFFASMDSTGGNGMWGFSTGRPFIFDRFIVNGSNQRLIDTALFPNPSAALGAQLVSNNVFFDGANAVAAANGSKPKLYAPSIWNRGSSISHLDTPTYGGTPNALMRHALAPGTSIHNPGPITLGIFQDLGWTVASQDTPIAGLTASNNSPTIIGNTTNLTATISAGTNVTYAWSFGDGTTGSGNAVAHTYSSTGSYTAVVTATNSSGSDSATTSVTVADVAISGLQASANGPTNVGNTTTLTATIAEGTNVTYAWSFGDGATGSGDSVAHTYQSIGSYTAVVTASNSAGSTSANVAVQVLASSVSATVTPNQGVLTTQDGSFQAFFPTGAVTQTVTVTYTAHLTPSQPLSDELTLMRDFTLEARAGDGTPVLSFGTPYTITLSYTDAEAAARNLDEASLKLVYWNGSAWVDVATCSACAVDTVANKITIALNYVGEFAVVGRQGRTLFVPIILR